MIMNEAKKVVSELDRVKTICHDKDELLSSKFDENFTKPCV